MTPNRSQIFFAFVGLLTVLSVIETNRDVSTIMSSISQMSRGVKPTVRTFEESLINDKTLMWLPNVSRPWLDGSPQPPAMLLLTNYKWNHPNQTLGLDNYRGLRSRELLEGVINHPWFHPTAWEDIESGKMNISHDIRYYVFTDKETCRERNYPNYGMGDMGNRDILFGRGECCVEMQDLVLARTFRSRLMMDQSANATNIFFECGGLGPKFWFRQARRKYKKRIVFASLSASKNQHIAGHDVGLPPGPCVRCDFDSSLHERIQSCAEEDSDRRPFLLVFRGNVARSQARRDLLTIHNGNDILVHDREIQTTALMNESNRQIAFRKMVSMSVFGAAPLGDNQFSYRFSELMSCGTIPVVYADNWVWPMEKIIHWEDVAVRIPEHLANQSESILRAIPKERRCKMRQNVIDTYNRYLKDGIGIISGIVESLEKR